MDAEKKLCKEKWKSKTFFYKNIKQFKYIHTWDFCSVFYQAKLEYHDCSIQILYILS